MNKRFFTWISAILVLLLAAGCGSVMHIDRGRVEDTFNLTITGEYPPEKNAALLPFRNPIIIKANTFFDLSALKLNNNPPRNVKNICTPDGYKKGAITSYEAKMETEDGKTFYGRIAFFQAFSKAAAKAVTSYYKISYSQKMPEATGGRTAFYFEYYDLHNKDFPTWIIWGSDAPLK